MVVRESHARGEALLVVGDVEVPVVGSSAHKGWMIAAASCRKSGAGSRVAVVSAHSHPIEGAGHERQALLPCSLKTKNVRVGAVIERCRSRPVKSPRDRINWISQVFVEKTGLNDAYRFHVVLCQQIEVLRVCWFQIGISLGIRNR